MPSTITSDQISHVYDYAWVGAAGKSKSTLTRDGFLIRTNECTNPGFEVDASGWSASGAETTTQAWTGTANDSTSTQSVNGVVKRTNLHRDPQPANLSTWNVFVGGPTNSTARITSDKLFAVTFGNDAPVTAWNVSSQGFAAVTAGKTYTFSVTGAHTWAGGQSRLTVEFKDAAGNSLGYLYPPDVTTLAASTFYRLRNTQTAPPNAATVNVFWDAAGTQPGANDSMLLRQLLIEESGSLGDYFDGSTPTSTKGLDVLRTTTVAHSGAAALQVRWRGQRGASMYAATSFAGLQKDTDYVASFWMSIPRALVKPVTVSIVTNGSGVIGDNPITIQPVTDGWQRVVMPFRTAVDRTEATLWFYDANSYLAGAVSQSVYVDDVLVETGGATLPYFDGDVADYVEYENTLPLVVNGWEEAANGLNVINPVVGGGFDVTLRGTSLRNGAFELVYEDEADAAAAFAMHRRPSTFTITDSDRASVGMRYVVDGQISRALDEEERTYWIVRVEYQEV